MTTIELTGPQVCALKLFSGSERICFDIDPRVINSRAFATDGKALLCMRLRPEVFRTSESFNGCVPIHCLDGIKPKHTAVTLTIEGTEGRVEYDKFVVNFSLLDGPIPSIDHALALVKDISGEPAQFDPELLMRFKKASAILNGRNAPPIIVGYNGLQPAAISLGIDNEVFGLLMPLSVREDHMPTTYPLWLAKS